MTIDRLIFLLLLVLVGTFGFLFLGVPVRQEGPPRPELPPPPREMTPTPPPGPSGAAPLTGIPLVIEHAEVIVLESDPRQLQLHVNGYQQDGCTAPVQTLIQRDGNAITVHIVRELPADAICPQVIKFYDDTIPLGEGFESGRYTITVNDYVLDVTL